MLAVGLESLPDNAAPTLAFTAFVLFQFVMAFNARVAEDSAFGPSFLRNSRLWAALAAVLALQVLAVASSVLVVEELRKLIARRR